MFMKVRKMIILSIFLLTMPGCFGGYSLDTGLEVSETVFLDDEYAIEVSVEKGEVFALDIPEPVAAGCRVSGAAFDPSMFRLERYLSYEDDGVMRVQYLFTALADGASDVNVKMRPTAGGQEDVYRTVHVVTGGESFFLF